MSVDQELRISPLQIQLNNTLCISDPPTRLGNDSSEIVFKERWDILASILFPCSLMGVGSKVEIMFGPENNSESEVDVNELIKIMSGETLEDERSETRSVRYDMSYELTIPTNVWYNIRD